MKKIIFTFLIISFSCIYANPSFTISSNYYLTIFAYPHDILKWPKSGVFMYVNPQTLPWQGDVTNIANRPNDTYISNYNDIQFPAPDDYTGSNPNSFLKVSSYAYINRYSVGGIHDLRKWGKVYLELGTSSTDLELNARGNVLGGNTDGSYVTVPFDAGTNALRRSYDFQAIYANYLFNNPFGVKLQYKSKDSKMPEGYLSYSKAGTQYRTNHMTWGWATVGCAKIFGLDHQNSDAWFLNDYTLYDGGELDLQASYEYKGNYKTGIRFRRTHESGKEYRWNDGSLNYINDPRYENEIDNQFIRAYSKVRFWKFNDLDLGVLFFAQYSDNDKRVVSSNKNIDSEPLRNDGENSFIIETNPFLNFKFEHGYFDIGVLCELSYASLANTESRWNGAMGADEKDVIRNSSAYDDWSPSWETFSQGSNMFFATGFEAYSSINVYGRLSLLSSLTLLRKYTSIDKEYGRSEIPAGGNSYVFNNSHTRNDFKNETWMTGSIGFTYGWGPLQTLITMQLPLAYLLEKTTELEKGSTQLLDKTQRNVWAVQEPIAFRMLFIFGLQR